MSALLRTALRAFRPCTAGCRKSPLKKKARGLFAAAGTEDFRGSSALGHEFLEPAEGVVYFLIRPAQLPSV